jgi:hypothetical protein
MRRRCDLGLSGRLTIDRLSWKAPGYKTIIVMVSLSPTVIPAASFKTPAAPVTPTTPALHRPVTVDAATREQPSPPVTTVIQHPPATASVSAPSPSLAYVQLAFKPIPPGSERRTLAPSTISPSLPQTGAGASPSSSTPTKPNTVETVRGDPA